MESSSLPLPKDLRWRRLLGVSLFLGLLFAFRALAPVLICFVIFERAFGFATDQLHVRAKLSKRAALAGVLLTFFASIAVAVVLGVQRAIGFVQLARTDGRAWINSITQSSLLDQARQRLGVDSTELSEAAKDYAMHAVGYLTATAYVALFVFVGLILAIMFLFERDDTETWLSNLRPTGIAGTLVRWLSYVADAVAITVRLQVVVAIFNAVFTLPLILLLGLPNAGLLFLLVLISGMIPVVGGLFSGSILCLVAYDTKGAMGVGIFLGVTFVLSKVESYYLQPRLTAQHVKIPGIALVISLLMFETLFGFWGLFLSFPALYVASRIANEWKEEEQQLGLDLVPSVRPESHAASSAVRPTPPEQPSAVPEPAPAAPTIPAKTKKKR